MKIQIDLIPKVLSVVSYVLAFTLIVFIVVGFVSYVVKDNRKGRAIAQESRETPISLFGCLAYADASSTEIVWLPDMAQPESCRENATNPPQTRSISD